MEKIRIGMIGFGGRGYGSLKGNILARENVDVVAVCDAYEDRMEKAAALVEEVRGVRPFATLDYHEVTRRDDVDVVIVTAAWEPHIDMAIDAMEHGKFVGIEVGGAYSLHDCFRLVDAYERTGVQCMMLENCCYGREELLVTNMVKKGLFGDIVHCAGGYQHDLRSEIVYGEEKRHYRLRNYMNRNCENYPTHELGPIAKVLNINRGNRMVSLTATASCSKGLHEFIRTHEDANQELLNVDFAQGDVFTTVIKCAHGQTITLTLDTTLPRCYTRNFTVRGTKGLYEGITDAIFLDGMDSSLEFNLPKTWGNIKDFREEHEHPIWKRFLDSGIRGGHGGMDWLIYSAFLESYERGIEPPIDTYDTAAWMAITPLSEESAAKGSAPVAIPDFTHGAWTNRGQGPEWEYSI